MSWADALDDLAGAVTAAAAFGEPVYLGDALTPCYGLFDPIGQPPAGFGSEVGLVGRLSAQPNPTLALSDRDAAGASVGLTLSVRGSDYVVTRLDPDGSGLTRLALMPAAASGAEAGSPWR